MGMTNDMSGNSLIPIKGISQAQKKALNTKCQIYDISGLLVKGRTPEQRAQLAKELGLDHRYVDLWVKQADLWRVTGMTADYAYLLVLIGIRCAKDLAKIDIEITKQHLRAVYNTHPGFIWDEEALPALAINAGLLESASISREYLSKNLMSLGLSPSVIDALQIDVSSGFDTSVIFDEDPPTYLFASDTDFKVLGLELESNVISRGLSFLQNIKVTLPLPRIISGQVKMRSVDQNKWDAKVTASTANLLVELSGIVNPSSESSEGVSELNAYTDGTGRFAISMPDKYSLKDVVTFTFSYGGHKQSFIKQASEIIDNTFIRNGGKDKDGKPLTAGALLALYDELDVLNNQLTQRELELRLLEKIDSIKEELQDVEKRIAALRSNYSAACDPMELERYDRETDESDRRETELKTELDLYNKKFKEAGIVLTRKELEDAIKKDRNKREEILDSIYGADHTTNDLEKTLTNLMSRTDLEVCFDGDETDETCPNKCFVIIKEVFEGYRDTRPRALPSVQLMGEGDKATWLPTDSAPSRTYNYTMLQRLVEPSISPAVGNVVEKENGRSQRRKMTSPVDVGDFKKKMYENPDSIPKMSSLGMGYVLNMHQAWVPDGFALGTLLYSLILAPGEEQRLIVRENTESYTITDQADASDSTSESTTRTQTDDIQAIYDYLLNQESEGSSSSKYKSSSWSIGSSLSGGGVCFSAGLTGGYSRSSGSASASARQTNNHSEASQAAQAFNQQFTVVSNMMAKAKRLSIRTATSSESDSVATKIIANHNHSHAMTVQYWEVVRRYRLETSIDGVDLLLFVPLNLIRFLPKGQLFHYPSVSSFNKTDFNNRYGTVLRYYNTLIQALPYKYRSGLNLIQRYASLHTWTMEALNGNDRTVTLKFKCNLFSFDDLKARMFLKNGKGAIAGSITFTDGRDSLPPNQLETTAALKQYIRDYRNKAANKYVTCEFHVPADVLDDDILSIDLTHSCDDLSFTLYKNPTALVYNKDGHETYAKEAITAYYNKAYDLAKDTKDSNNDQKKMDFWRSQLPEAYFAPVVFLTAYQLKALGVPTIDGVNISGANLSAVTTNNQLNPTAYINISSKVTTLRYNEFQQMEAALQHIASETLHYSQKVWQSLSSNELAMMLEQYSIDMNFKTYFDMDDTETQIPLLNCVNIKKVMGFYGNCLLLPFTYPDELAKKLGKTAAEIQDALYRYHTTCFRSPNTIISIPTEGMIGEAVLGATNVSEEIDLTRFWNWKDSPIDSMTLDSSYLNGNDYLADKTTKDVSALNLQTATPVSPVTSADLISALVAKQTPTFDNITGLDQVASVLNTATQSTSKGRDNVVNQSATLANKAMEYATEKMKAESKERIAKINAGEKDDAPATGGKNPGKGTDGSREEDGRRQEEEYTEDEHDDYGTEDAWDNNDENSEENSDVNNDENSEDDETSLLNSILEKAVDAIRVGTRPEDFFASLTNTSLDSDKIKNIAKSFCSGMGTDIDTVLSKIMS